MAGKGQPKSGGRQPGSVNKATADIKALAQKHGEAAIKGLLSIAETSKQEATKVIAWKELLDRGYGKSSQAIDISGNVTITTMVNGLKAARDRKRDNLGEAVGKTTGLNGNGHAR